MTRKSKKKCLKKPKKTNENQGKSMDKVEEQK